MSYRIYNNTPGRGVDIHVYSSNSNLRITGNSSQSNLAVNATSSEVISGAMIERVIVTGESAAVWTISTGNSTSNTLIGYFGAGLDFDVRDGMAISTIGDNIYFTNLAGANSSIFIKLRKN